MKTRCRWAGAPPGYKCYHADCEAQSLIEEHMDIRIKDNKIDVYHKGHRVVLWFDAKGPRLTHNHSRLVATGLYPPPPPKKERKTP